MANESLGDALGVREDLIKKACERAFNAHHEDGPFLRQMHCYCHSSSELIISFPPSWSVPHWFATDDQTFGEIKIDLSLFPSLKSIGNNEAALVHKATLIRFKSLLSNQTFQSEVETATRDGKRIVFTGHSSGGSMAILATLWKLEQERKQTDSNVVCLTFGSPLVGNHIFSHATKRENWSGHFVHFVLRYDIVPRMSLAPISSVAGIVGPILQILSQENEPAAEPVRYSEFYNTVMKNAATLASHGASSLMGTPNLLLETMKNFVVMSPYRPFGTFVLCTGNGKLIVMKNSEAVLQVLFHSAMLSEEGEGDEVAMEKVLQHLGYENEVEESLGGMQNVVYLDKLEQVPLSQEDSSNHDAANVDTALNDLGLGTRARLCLRAAGELEKQKHSNEKKMINELNEVQRVMKDLADYKEICRGRKVGYYDSFKLQNKDEDFKANVNRLELASVWDEIIEMLKLYQLPDELEGNRDWVKKGTEFRRLVEPLDIANYYRHSKNEDTGPYTVRARPKRYRYTQRWIEHYDRMETGASSESCFWAETEELISKTKKGVFEGDFKERIEKLAEDFNKWVVKDGILKDVLLEETTFMKWVKGTLLPKQFASIFNNVPA